MEEMQKPVVYQVFTRLFGSDANVNQHDGSRAVNGCGTMAAFTPQALAEIKKLGATHIWYTGIIEHATQTDYSAYGIARDHHAVVKGKAGSAYAIKDYYDVDPDIATSVPARMHEFEELVARTHQAGLKVVIDFVPNHVARQYHSDVCPEGVEDLGAQDDTTQHFSPSNNFYYFPGEQLHTDFDLQADEPQPYFEQPARATGNDVFSSFAKHDDWYETVKLNYGVDYLAGRTTHFDPVPSTWEKMTAILLFWASKGVDAFRCDMAEMVPAEFWGYATKRVRQQYPDIQFIAEIYGPDSYRRYISEGGFDYLYDKVGLYDTLRAVTCGYANADAITHCWQAVDDIRDHMLSFLENHDEQRIASDYFAGSGEKGRPAMIVAATISRGPVMIYFGQELGERAMDEEGFSGRDGRTTIFDYWTVNSIYRWRNGGTFDGRQLTPQEVELQSFYSTLLNLCSKEKAIREGDFYDLMYANPKSDSFNPRTNYAYLRRAGQEVLLCVTNFDSEDAVLDVNIPAHVFELYQLRNQQKVTATDLLSGTKQAIRFCADQPSQVKVPANSGVILKIK
ncbi:MAG: alpha-amylase [Bacteroidaceae bacterium]|nr:alpha-amylase [Bacteroidaceae bacterium]